MALRGYKITKFFHLFIVIRRNKNPIVAIKNYSSGDWFLSMTLKPIQISRSLSYIVPFIYASHKILIISFNHVWFRRKTIWSGVTLILRKLSQPSLKLIVSNFPVITICWGYSSNIIGTWLEIKSLSIQALSSILEELVCAMWSQVHNKYYC